MYKQISPNDFKEKFMKNPYGLEIIDVRTPEEFSQIKIKGSKLINMNELGSRLNEIDWSKEVIFVCRSGSRSGHVTQILTQNGYNAANLAGGIGILQINCQECMETGQFDRSYFN